MMATVSNEVDSLRSYKRAVVNVFNSHHAILNSVLENCMAPFAEHTFAAGLISISDMRTKKFASIFSQFIFGLELCGSILEVQKRWKILIDILEDLGGPPRMAGRNLNEELSSLTGM